MYPVSFRNPDEVAHILEARLAAGFREGVENSGSNGPCSCRLDVLRKVGQAVVECCLLSFSKKQQAGIALLKP